MDGRSAATDIECLWTNMEIWVGTTHLVFCTIRILFIEMYKRSVAYCKHFGPRSGFPYYNVRTPHREGFPYPPPVLSSIPQSYMSSVVQISPNYNHSYSIRFLPVVYLSVWLNVFGLMCVKYFISIQVRCI